jgi:hypothetical protein
MSRLVMGAAAAVMAALVVTAAAAQEPNPLTQIRPGETKAAGIEAMFGAPVEREGMRARYQPNRGGVRELVAWFGDDGAVKWARIALVNELPAAAAALLFDVAGELVVTRGNAFRDEDDEATLTEHYGGVHLVVAGGKVRYVWLTGPEERPSEVAKAATLLQATAATVLPASADGTAVPGGAGTTEDGGIDRTDFGNPDTSLRTIPYTPGGTVVESQGDVPSAAPATAVVPEAGTTGQQAFPPDPNAMPRSLNVHYVWYGLPQDPSTTAMEVFARVNAVGLKDRTVTMRLTLATARGSAGGQSKLGVSFSDTVAYDVSAWEQAHIGVPAQEPAARQGAAILHWQAECDGLTSYAEAEYTAEAAAAAASGAQVFARAVTMTNVRVEHGATLGEFQGMWAYADIGAVGFNGRPFAAEVRFRIPGGAVVRPPANVQGASGPDGAVALAAQDTAANDNTSWTPFRIFVPYIAFGLPQGTHRVIMTYRASCDGLAAAAEQEIDVGAP